MLRSKLINDLIAAHGNNNEQVKDMRIGLSWAAVFGKYCGLAKTYGSPAQRAACVENLSRFRGKDTAEIAEYAQSWDLAEASIGCAAIQSMVKPRMDGIEINADRIILQRGAGARVVMVGAFPFIDRLKAVARELYVLELNQSILNSELGIIPETAADYVIPDCDLLVITGSSIVNKSLERLLGLARKSKAYTIILGPSTIFSDVLFDYGADMLAGSVVLKPYEVMKRLSDGIAIMDTGLREKEIVFKVVTKQKACK